MKSSLSDILILTLAVLILGVLGFYLFERMDMVSSFYNTCAIMSVVGLGTGPQRVEGKIFAGLFSLGIGLGYIFIIAFLIKNYFEEPKETN